MKLSIYNYLMSDCDIK